MKRLFLWWCVLFVTPLLCGSAWIFFTPIERHAPTQWLTLYKNSPGDIPDIPTQVYITISTADGRKWEANWREKERTLLDK